MTFKVGDLVLSVSREYGTFAESDRGKILKITEIENCDWGVDKVYYHYKLYHENNYIYTPCFEAFEVVPLNELTEILYGVEQC